MPRGRWKRANAGSRSWMPAPCVSIMVRSDRRGSKEWDDLAVHGIQAPTEAFVGFLPQLEDGHIRDIMNVAHGGERTGRTLTSSTSIIRGGPDEGLPRRGGRQPPAAPRSRLSERALNSIVESPRARLLRRWSCHADDGDHPLSLVADEWPGSANHEPPRAGAGGPKGNRGHVGGASRSQSIEDLLLLPCAIPRRTDTNQMSVWVNGSFRGDIDRGRLPEPWSTVGIPPRSSRLHPESDDRPP